MFTFILIIHVIISLLLIVTILMQQSKGGLSDMFGGAQESFFGASGADTFFSKFTAILAGLFMITSISLALLSSGGKGRAAAPQDIVPQIPTENTTPVVPQDQNNSSEIPALPQGE